MEYVGNQACCCNNSLALSVGFLLYLLVFLWYLLVLFGVMVVCGGIIGELSSILILN